MIPTYTTAIKEKIIKDYLGSNLVVALINNINLGITDLPSSTQLEARENYNINNLLTNEIGASNLNGYKRALILNNTITTSVTSPSTIEANFTVNFEAIGGNFDPFSHIVVIRGANITNALPSNGNNRGDVNGTIIFIEPVNNILNPAQPLVLQQGITYTYNFKLISAADTL